MAEQVKNGELVNIEAVQLACIKCTIQTWHRVIVEVDESGYDGHPDDGVQWRTEHQIVQCNGCKTISYRSAGTHSEDYDEDYDGRYWRVTEKLFPPRQFKRTIDDLDSYSLPDRTRALLKEAHDALANNQFILAGVGLRGLIETIVKERQAKGKNLYKQIDDLVSQKVLTPARADVLHKIRSLGNDAAHEAAPHDVRQLGLAMEIVESVLQEVYILPDKARKVFKPKPLVVLQAPIAVPVPAIKQTTAPQTAASPMPPSSQQSSL